MKFYVLLAPFATMCLTGCDMEHKINQATCEINRNSDAIERSTEAIHRNLVELEKIRQSR